METIGFMQVLPPKTPEEAALQIILYINECQKIDATPRTEKVADMIRLAFPRMEMPPIQPYMPSVQDPSWPNGWVPMSGTKI